MAPSLYQQAISQMFSMYPEVFGEFRRVHDLYQKDPPKWKKDFDRIGKDILKIIESTEHRLCSKMENSNRGKFSNTLSEKFRQEIRHTFPLIDLVGIVID